MDPVTSIFGAAGKLLSAEALSAQISDIYKSIANVYSDVADAQVQTARQAFSAAQYTNQPAREYASAITSLAGAYNTYAKLIGKFRKERFLLFFSSNEAYIEDEEKFYREMTRIATIICWYYRSLNEEKNALYWHDNAFRNYEKYIQEWEPEPQHLRAISDEYAYEDTYEKEKDRKWCGDGMPDYVEYETVTEWRITSEGYDYIEKLKKELIEEYPSILRSPRLESSFQSNT